MKQINYLFLLILITFLSCKESGQLKQQEVLTEEKKLTIISEIQSLLKSTVGGLNNLNVDSVFKSMSAMNFSTFINNGVIFSDYDSTYATFKKMYAQIESLNVVLSNEKYTVLSVNSALFSAGFKEDLIVKNKNFSNQGAMTCVFQRIDNNWKMIHVHQSYFPIIQ